jgi:hypothetical protein
VLRGNDELLLFCTVSERLAMCERLPLVPCAVIVKFPVAALAAAPNTTGKFAPAATPNGLGGFDATPMGKPFRVT